MKNNRTPGKYKVATTPAGKYKVVDFNGFSIATSPDATNTSKANIEFLAKAPDMEELLKRLFNSYTPDGYRREDWTNIIDSIARDTRELLSTINDHP